MALEKQTKSIQLAQGMREDADDFLMEPPATEYVENGRFDKRGVISKRQGFDALPSNGLSTALNGDPTFLHAIDDTLVTVSKDAVHKFDGASWTSVPSAAPITQSRRLLGTDAVRGMTCADVIQVTGGFLVVYEIKKTLPAGGRDLVLQAFTEDGVFLHQRFFGGRRSPRWVPKSGAEAYLMYADFTGTVKLKTLTYNLDNTVVEIAGERFPGIGLADENPIFRDSIISPPPGFVLRDSAFVLDTTEEFAQYEADGVSGGDVAAAATDDTAFEIEVRRFDSALVQIGLTRAITAAAGERLRVLNVLATGSAHYILFMRLDGEIVTDAGQNHSIEIHKYDSSNVFVWSRVIFTTTGGNDSTLGDYQRALHGGLELDDSGNLFYCAYVYEPIDSILTTFAGLHYGTVLESSGVDVEPRRFVFHHRMTTKPKFFDGSFYVGVQQYSDLAPFANRPQDFDADVGNIQIQKPVSSMLCRVDFLKGVFIPISTANAGSSKHSDATEPGLNHFLLPLDHDGTRFLFPNREAKSAGDVITFFGNGIAPINVLTRGWQEILGGEGQINLFDVRLGAGTETASFGFGDGVLVGGGTALWFDGSRLAEMLPFDSPEIIYLRDEQAPTGRTHSLLEAPQLTGPNPGEAAEDMRGIQLIVGYKDKKGNLHRSAPSLLKFASRIIPESFVDAGVNLTAFFTMPLSLYVDGEQTYFVEVYVSSLDSTTPRLAGTKIFSLDGMPSPSPFSVQFTTSTLELPSGDQKELERGSVFPYTTGGVLAADPWPSFTAMVATSDRVFAISAEAVGTVFYSKQFEEFIAPEFSASLVVALGDERELTALGRLDDKVVIFEANEIHILYGTGPDNTGSGQDFALHHISSDVGCIDPKSVIETPQGLIFLSARGFHKLDRSMSVSFLGGPVEDMARFIKVDAATLVATEGEVRFAVRQDPDFPSPLEAGPDPDVNFLDDGIIRPPRPKFSNVLPANAALVWNYERNAWSVFSNYATSAATIYQRRFTRLLPDWSVWQESLDRWDDPVGTNRMLIITPWIKLRAMQDYNRLWRVTFLGRYLSAFRLIDGAIEAGDIQVTLAYDYEFLRTQLVNGVTITNTTTAVFEATKAFGFEKRNEQGTVGLPLDARAERLQFAVRPGRRRVQALQCTIEEIGTPAIKQKGGLSGFLAQEDGSKILQEDGNGILLEDNIIFRLGRGFEITSIDLTYGAKPTSVKTLSAQRKK